MKLTYRTDKEIKFENATGFTEEYEILANFPFSSDTKRMGIVLKNKHHGHIIFYLKGAENVIEKFVKDEYKSYIRENAENLAMTGLRTLVLTQRIIPQDEFTTWYTKYNEALTSMENRKEKIASTISELEHNMDFLCVTGVEDLLQDEVNLTLENLRNAGMKIWMLTGDKIETAKCIAISAGLKAKNHKIYTIRYDEFPRKGIDSDINTMHEYLERYNAFHKDPHILIIDGDALDLALRHCEREFFETAMKAPSVVCCRCSPTQKCIIVKTIKKYTRPNERTAAVGDGGNDVAMIQEADVGIGIVGKEGLQASLASDYSILKFNYLNTLLLWWGRLSYKNTSSMSNFVIHRGLIISLIQFIFSLMFYYNPVALYNGVLVLGYSTVYTSFPAISVLVDKDTHKKNVMSFPALYKALLRGRELSVKTFLWWVFKSIYQAGVIMIGSVYLFEDNLFLKIVSVTFSVLIFVEILNVYTEIKEFHWFMGLALIGTAVTYSLTLIFFKSILDVVFIFEPYIIWRIAVIALACWAPFFLLSKVKRKCFPEEYEKLNISNRK
jgi:phospholipid-translocating ATPase